MKITKQMIKKFEAALSNNEVTVKKCNYNIKRAVLTAKYANNWNPRIEIESKYISGNEFRSVKFYSPLSSNSGVLYDKIPTEIMHIAEDMLPLVKWSTDDINKCEQDILSFEQQYIEMFGSRYA